VDSALAIAAEAEPVAANTRMVMLSENLSGPAAAKLPSPVVVRVTDSTARVLGRAAREPHRFGWRGARTLDAGSGRRNAACARVRRYYAPRSSTHDHGVGARRYARAPRPRRW
jgi:hypothetical protein